MSTNNKHKVSEKELDNLLGQVFLNLDFNNPKNQELMETISNQVLSAQPINTGFINKAFFTKLAVSAVIIVASVFIYFNYFKNNGNNNPIQNTNTTTASVSSPEQIIKAEEQTTSPGILNNKSESKSETPMTVYEPGKKEEPVLSELPKHQLPLTVYSDENKTKPDDTSYVFPKLTEKEIKATEKQKLVMLMQIIKQSKNKFALITPKAGGSVYSSITDTSATFYMQNAEVTNLEYRTFLFDLLIYDQKADFLIAKPQQSLWLNTNGSTRFDYLKDLYFSDKRFNDYPVVNISPAGAELYCKWLSTLTQKEHTKITARLPYENEWVFAAHGGQNSSYPWGTEEIQNTRGCFLANFCIKKEPGKLNRPVSCDPKKYPDAYTSAGLMLGDSVLTCKTTSYNLNDYGLFCTAGNAAEMVYDNKTKAVKAKGGSWNSDLENCKINNSEFNEGVRANPTTGFRPIFRIYSNTYIGTIAREDQATGLPTMTAEEIENNSKNKKKMVDALMKLNKDKYAYIPMGSCLYKKEMVSVEPFYMETTEVTNLEYRTFLLDLLISGKTEDYLLAKPDQRMWKNKFPYSFNDPMVDMYFSHPAYDEYPVVNISRKAAQMYCDWLTIETNKVLKENGKPLMNDLRIPDEYEWALAASNGKNSVKYANGKEFLKDNKGRYEVNYMCYAMEDCKFDSILKVYVPKTKNADFTADGAFHTALTRSYSPNGYGLYCMAGNVSEMMKNYRTNKTSTKGGSWFSCDHFLEIDAEDEFNNETGPSPLIGFRPVFTAPKKRVPF